MSVCDTASINGKEYGFTNTNFDKESRAEEFITYIHNNIGKVLYFKYKNILLYKLGIDKDEYISFCLEALGKFCDQFPIEKWGFGLFTRFLKFRTIDLTRKYTRCITNKETGEITFTKTEYSIVSTNDILNLSKNNKGVENDVEYEDMLYDLTSPEEIDGKVLLNDDQKRIINEEWEKLPSRSRDIYLNYKHIGLSSKDKKFIRIGSKNDHSSSMTLGSLGKKYNLTESRISQIVNGEFNKFKSNLLYKLKENKLKETCQRKH